MPAVGSHDPSIRVSCRKGLPLLSDEKEQPLFGAMGPEEDMFRGEKPKPSPRSWLLAHWKGQATG